MRKTVSRVLSIALALGLCGSLGGSAHAGGFETNSKKTRRAYLHHQKKQKKNFSKNAKKQQKDLKKQHEA